MRICASAGTAADLPRHGRTPAAAAAAGEVRIGLPALVEPTRPRGTFSDRPHTRPAATLLAQLMAGMEGLPAARVKRRIEPSAGADAYRAVAALGGGTPPPRPRSL